MIKQKITKEMKISDVLAKYPQTMEIFGKYNLYCIGCAAAQYENLGALAQEFGINLDEFVKELNKKVE